MSHVLDCSTALPGPTFYLKPLSGASGATVQALASTITGQMLLYFGDQNGVVVSNFARKINLKTSSLLFSIALFSRRIADEFVTLYIFKVLFLSYLKREIEYLLRVFIELPVATDTKVRKTYRKGLLE